VPEGQVAVVKLTRDELFRLWDQVSGRRVMNLSDSEAGMIVTKDNPCPFLMPGIGCKIYANRPESCRSYPFWPEFLASKEAWEEEMNRCPGMEI
jgi:Fe-S-cluster containining protein